MVATYAIDVISVFSWISSINMPLGLNAKSMKFFNQEAKINIC